MKKIAPNQRTIQTTNRIVLFRWSLCFTNAKNDEHVLQTKCTHASHWLQIESIAYTQPKQNAILLFFFEIICGQVNVLRLIRPKKFSSSSLQQGEPTKYLYICGTQRNRYINTEVSTLSLFCFCHRLKEMAIILWCCCLYIYSLL